MENAPPQHGTSPFALAASASFAPAPAPQAVKAEAPPDVDGLLQRLGSLSDTAQLFSPDAAQRRLACVEELRDMAKEDGVDAAKRLQAQQKAHPVLSRLSRDDPDPGVRRAAVEALSAMAKSVEDVPMWSKGAGASPSPARPVETDAQRVETTQGAKKLPPGRVPIEAPFSSVAGSSSQSSSSPASGPAANEDERRRQHLAEKEAARQRIREREEESDAAEAPQPKRGKRPGDLRAALKALRSQLAKEQDKQSFMVFPDAVLGQLVDKKPSNATALRKISGIGPDKQQRYGQQILACIRAHGGGGSDELDDDEPPEAPAPAAPLNQEQIRAVQLAMAGESFFLTGGAGTGKSFTLHRIIEAVRSQVGTSGVFTTGSTGIAACAIGGCTVHSFAGVGLGRESVDALIDRVRQKPHAMKTWLNCQVLIIDEVSMLDGGFFDKLESMARMLRDRPDEPFGGIRVILCGDFYQLPPVGLEQQGNGLSFLFEASCWRHVVRHTIMLNEVFRQKDQHFVRMLNELRRAQLSPFSISMLQQAVNNRSQPLASTAAPGTAQAMMTRLCPMNAQADQENEARLSALPERLMLYEAANMDPTGRMMESCTAPAKLALKKGAQVVLLKNLDQAKGLVNGSRGVVVGFSPSDAPMRRGTDVAQAPIESFESPPAQLAAATPLRLYPRVRFFRDGEERLLLPDQWTIESGGRVVASRTQVPCKLAWALSIHKSQGMTLENLEVDLGRCFDSGQAYVAMSRATSLHSTRVLSFDPARVRAHPKVERFYQALEEQSQLERQQLAGSAAAAGPSSVASQQEPASSSGGGMTTEQLARMAANREAALARRRAAQPPGSA
tara:strand:- start:4 stop:2529 length:2526 start_codon:yes stop_codon:yes gene_type:complete